MNKTTIDWTDLSWNVVTGCSRGCSWCYAARISKRFGRSFEPTFHPERLGEPLKRKKPSKIFACSMGDLFDPEIPFESINKAWAVMLACGDHTFQVLTKRPERMLEFFAGRHHPWQAADGPNTLPPNVWLGVSITNQQDADERIPLLLQVPAAVRWVSYEPALGPLDLTPYLHCEFCAGEPVPYSKGTILPSDHTDHYHPARIRPRLDWVVCGAQTGPGAVAPDSSWVDQLIGQCESLGAHAPIYVKSNVAKALGWPDVPAGLQKFPEVMR